MISATIVHLPQGTLTMLLEFDEQKRAATLENRGLDFCHAVQVFEGPIFTLIDEREDYGEIRYLTYGRLGSKTVAIVWTQRGQARRIISMRECHAKERNRYEDQLDRSG
jgi:uncharacterized DUF497 family protein